MEFRREWKTANKCDKFGGVYAAFEAQKRGIPVVKADLAREDVLKTLVLDKKLYSYYDFQGRWMINNAKSAQMFFGDTPNAEQQVRDFKATRYNSKFGAMFTVKDFENWFLENFDMEFAKTDLVTFTANNKLNYPSSKGYITNRLSEDEDFHARDPFMLKNIAAALNRYDTVLAVFGEGHYVAQASVLQDMLGSPQYITEVDPLINTGMNKCKKEILPVKGVKLVNW
ncbi:hypothetical protein AAIR98_001850 [Elusimicrobium simillimum]|uniref:hypothetical protein n=1 Tax=Elusimicrobium simillimum TaxID=3143438 RepID=UPI003C70589F